MKSLWISIAVFGCAACGSAPDASVFSGGSDAAVGTDSTIGGADTSTTTDSTTSGDDTRHGNKDTGSADDTTPPPIDTAPPPPTPVTLDNVCDRLADAICTSSTQTCCTTRGVPYDAAGCRTGVQTWCKADVAAVGAGSMTFDAGAFEACASALGSIESTCSVPILTYVKTYVPCDQLFDGKGAPGDPCSSVADCHAAAGSYAECRSESGTCEQVVIVPKDGSCSFSGPVLNFCDSGLYCSTSTNTCRTAKSTGSGCSGTFDTSCGFGNSCSSGHCAPGLPAGAPCGGNLECASWNCSSTTGQCTDPNVEWGTPQTCSGAAP